MLKLCLGFLVDILFCVKCMPSKTKHSDSLVLVSEFLVVVILSISEWWLFCHSCSSLPSESTVLKKTSLCPIAVS